MARNLEPKHKMCRRFGEKLCDSPKCPVVRRNYPPGVHGPKGKQRISEFGRQLKEKQKAKAIYGVLERQFEKIIDKAVSKKGNSAEMLYQLLETRLDNVVYRLGFAKSRQQARQLVSHNQVTVNGKTTSIPSYQVHINDVVGLRKKGVLIYASNKTAIAANIPEWIAFDEKQATGKIQTLPQSSQQSQPLDLKLIIEYYSR